MAPVPYRPSVLSLVLAAVLCAGPGAAERAAAAQQAPDLSAGQAAYVQSCARCHGDQGRGDGVDAQRFYPRPRDLTKGIYKFRSTASGTPPTDQDLFDTITRGLPGTNMPDWQQLDEATRWNLVAYLKSLSPVFAETPPSPVTLAPSPARADLAKGQQVYAQLGCAACHGPAGRANGTSAAGLVDDWGLPIRPANLTHGWALRGGHDPRAILLRVVSGIDGTGMPSYADAVSPEDAWQLAYYVASLQEAPQWNAVADVAVISGTLPATPEDAAWAAAARTDLRLRNAVTREGVWEEPPTVQAVTVHALTNGATLAIRLTWDDPSENRSEPADAAALLLKPAGTEGDAVTLQAWPYHGAPALDVCLWSAQTGRIGEAVAGSFDRARAGNGSLVPLAGQAQYTDGRWTLVMQRPLQPEQPSGAGLVQAPGLTAVAVAVWDGGNPTARAVSPWLDLRLRTTTRTHH